MHSIDPAKVIAFAKSLGQGAAAMLIFRQALISYVKWQTLATGATAAWGLKLKENVATLIGLKGGVKAATLAVKILSSTMGGLGLTAIIAGASYLWSKFSDNTDEATKSLQNFKEELDPDPEAMKMAEENRLRGGLEVEQTSKKLELLEKEKILKEQQKRVNIAAHEVDKFKAAWEEKYENQKYGNQINILQAAVDAAAEKRDDFRKEVSESKESLKLTDEKIKAHDSEVKVRRDKVKVARDEARFQEVLNSAQLTIIDGMKKQTNETKAQIFYKKRLMNISQYSAKFANEELIMLQTIAKDPALLASFELQEKKGQNVKKQLERWIETTEASGDAGKEFIKQLKAQAEAQAKVNDEVAKYDQQVQMKIDSETAWMEKTQFVWEHATSAATSYYEQQVSNRHSDEQDALSAERNRINNMKISQGAKDRLIASNQRKQDALDKKHHNEKIDTDIKLLWAEFAGMAGSTLLNTLMANAKVRATIPPGFQELPIGRNWKAYYSGLAAGAAESAKQTGMLAMQKKAVGADYITSGPELLMVGENPGGKERVQITPLTSPNFEGPAGGGAAVNITFTGNVLSDDFIEDIAIPRIKDAVRRGADLGVG